MKLLARSWTYIDFRRCEGVPWYSQSFRRFFSPPLSLSSLYLSLQCRERNHNSITCHCFQRYLKISFNCVMYRYWYFAVVCKLGIAISRCNNIPERCICATQIQVRSFELTAVAATQNSAVRVAAATRCSSDANGKIVIRCDDFTRKNETGARSRLA